MKYLSLFLLIAFFFFIQACKSAQELPPALYNKWMHVFEEDSAGYRMYRPTSLGAKLPPAHGRQVYEILPDHGFILHTFGPADRPIAHKGSWEKVDENRIKVQIEEKGVGDFSLQIIDLSADRLLVKQE
jgi:hypothetical protein